GDRTGAGRETEGAPRESFAGGGLKRLRRHALPTPSPERRREPEAADRRRNRTADSDEEERSRLRARRKLSAAEEERQAAELGTKVKGRVDSDNYHKLADRGTEAAQAGYA